MVLEAVQQLTLHSTFELPDVRIHPTGQYKLWLAIVFAILKASSISLIVIKRLPQTIISPSLVIGPE
jgi:hypothetical protein